MKFEENKTTSIAAKYLNGTGKHIFLTGRAGTGKTTFLKHTLPYTYKNYVITAPTGVAAINAGGTTLHSQFQLPIAAFVPDPNYQTQMPNHFVNPRVILQNFKMSQQKRSVLQALELLVIDEVSMLRADILDAVNAILQHVRKNRLEAFGGVQVLFIGDLLQLPPVVKSYERNVLSEYYKSFFFFDALVLKDEPLIHIELDKIYRQSDQEFVSILENLRNNRLTKTDQAVLNQHFREDTSSVESQNYIFLTTHNRSAEAINERRLASLESRAFAFEAKVKGKFPESMYPLDEEIILKEGAQVMFVKNDYSQKRRYFNGKIGTIIHLNEEEVVVGFADGSSEVIVDFFTWENTKFDLNKETGQIESNIKGTFTQLPLRTAWAITIHKSQGLTFQKAIIDIAEVFSAGQMYVAFSRLVSLEGLVLASRITDNYLEVSPHITEFNKTKANCNILESEFKKECFHFIMDYVRKSFDFTHLKSQVAYFLNSFNKDKSRSKKQRDGSWAKAIFVEVAEWQEVSVKFINQIKRKTNVQNFKTFLPQRVRASLGYFTPLFEKLIKDMESKCKVLKEIEGVKEYCQEVEALKKLLEDRFSRLERANNMVKKLPQERGMVRDTPLKSTFQKAETKTSTYEISYALYKQGMSLEEIAKERNLNIRTIESHFAKWVEKGKVDFDAYISKEEVLEIIEVAEKLDNYFLKPIKEHFEDRFTYFQINIAMSFHRQKT